MSILSLTALRAAAQQEPVEARVHLQFLTIREKSTREGKPYYEIAAGDGGAKMTLRVWNNSPLFSEAASWRDGEFFEVHGRFQVHPAFGLDAAQWEARALEEAEVSELLGGSEELRGKQARDYESIVALVGALNDPRLKAWAELFLSEWGERFRRAAAARTYHHARRGGLVEHTAQMMRTAEAIASVYPTLNRDLLIAGALFHDIGKLWENCPPPRGFDIAFDETGELLGHITLGIELLNHLWRKLAATEEAAGWAALTPPSDEVRKHLLHLIASHHGEMAFGSPVVPKTPEAFALHYIDNLDARLEMVFAGYEAGTPLTAQITERVRPLPGNLVRPLSPFSHASHP